MIPSRAERITLICLGLSLPVILLLPFAHGWLKDILDGLLLIIVMITSIIRLLFPYRSYVRKYPREPWPLYARVILFIVFCAALARIIFYQG